MGSLRAAGVEAHRDGVGRAAAAADVLAGAADAMLDVLVFQVQLTAAGDAEEQPTGSATPFVATWVIRNARGHRQLLVRAVPEGRRLLPRRVPLTSLLVITKRFWKGPCRFFHL